MNPVNLVISSFSTEHSNERRIPVVRNDKGIIKQIAVCFINCVSYTGKCTTISVCFKAE